MGCDFLKFRVTYEVHLQGRRVSRASRDLRMRGGDPRYLLCLPDDCVSRSTIPKREALRRKVKCKAIPVTGCEGP
jgi:hypothetical protein